MAGIYVHIPFCKQACNYCNFHFTVSKKQLPEMISAIAQEAILQKKKLPTPVIIDTVYFGGGTPSILSTQQLTTILTTIQQQYNLGIDAEITLEVNPDDCSTEKLQQWHGVGINRLSIGVQSFRENDLVWMNRSHHAETAITAIEQAHVAGFTNISIDLIYGIPGLSNEDWYQNIQKAIALPIQHLSCYALTVEPKTALHHYIQKKTKSNIDANAQAMQFELLMEWLPKAGFEHYEVSNFAKPGYQSKHNSNYWKGIPYIGLGPSAHSYNGIQRQWNIANNHSYIQHIQNGHIPAEIETLTAAQKRNEQIMIGLRTKEGIELQKLKDTWSQHHQQQLIKAAQKWINKDLMEWLPQTQQLRLTQKGMLYADGIASDLFEV
jgi:oxygen-independent coproporphyrinogen-3 oxidase